MSSFCWISSWWRRAVDFGGSSVEFFHLDVAGLVEVGDPAALGGGFLDAAGEAVELGVEDFVVGGGLAGDERLLAGEQHVGAQQDLAYLVEHERVELVGADRAARCSAGQARRL